MKLNMTLNQVPWIKLCQQDQAGTIRFQQSREKILKMKASKQITEGRRQFLSSEYRVLDPTNKALKLLEKIFVVNEQLRQQQVFVEIALKQQKTIKNGRPIKKAIKN